MSFVLIFWTVVGSAGNLSITHKYDWRPLSDFPNSAACHNAAKALGIPADRYRCIDKNVGAAK